MRNLAAILLLTGFAPAAAATELGESAVLRGGATNGNATHLVEVDTVETPVERWRADPTHRFEASEVDLENFRWIARPVVVFGDSPEDPRFQQQMDYIAESEEELAERDVVVVTDAGAEEGSEVRDRLRPRGFMLVLIGKDGQVKLRKPYPWDVREIGRSIDKMPMRQREIRERRGADR